VIKNKKKILLISYCLPPETYPESYVSAKIINKLSNYFEIDVLTSSVKKSPLIKDFSLDSYFTKDINITNVEPSRLLEFFIKIPRFPVRPDRWILLYFSMINKLKSIDLLKYDYFFTRSQFHSAHLIGLFLKKRFPKKKWITSFSDPWSSNSYQSKVPIFDSISSMIEKKVLNKSDLLIFPLVKLKDHFIGNSNDSLNKKSLIIPHTIDLSLYPNELKKNRYFTIRFFGKIYGDRNIIPFFNALKIILKENKNIRVEFYSRKEKIFDYLSSDFSLKKYVSFRPYLDYLEALKLMKSTDLLLIFDSNDDKNSIFFQSKVLDYIGSKSRILHIGNLKNLNKILTTKSNGLSSNNELNSILAKLKEAIYKKNSFKHNSSLINKYDSKRITNELYNKIISLDKIND
jgi:hypothetical protein